jgi:hypothetical protein
MIVAEHHGQLDAIHARQHDIEDGEVGFPGGEGLDGFFGGLRGAHHVAVVVEDGGEGFGDDGLVVDDENPASATRSRQSHLVVGLADVRSIGLAAWRLELRHKGSPPGAGAVLPTFLPSLGCTVGARWSPTRP